MEKLKNNNSSRVCTGLVVLAIGVVFLLDNIGLKIPRWIIDWPMLFIAIGLILGYKRQFVVGPWMLIVAIGGFFTFESIANLDFSRYYFALIFIAIGAFLIIKPKSKSCSGKRCRKKRENKYADLSDLNVNSGEEKVAAEHRYDNHNSDFLESVNVFAGSHQKVYSKKFKGGEVVAVFGGSDINLSQADFEGTITLEVVAVFGGVKIVIPPDWEVKSEVTAIFGGIDDKRALAPATSEPKKLLIINGVAFFGGVDIRNF